MMKKLLGLTLCMIFALAACGTQSDESASNNQEASVSEQLYNADSLKDDNQSDAFAPDTEDTEENDTQEESIDGKVLVAYFSCTGNTEGIAGYIVSILDADAYEIVPEEPYTDADLDYGDSSGRTTLEQNDDSARPAVSGSVENMEDYDIIFIGYPIWWGQAPKIIYTFVESYDLSGKTIVPFCTSASSGIGSSAANLEALAVGANWLDGTRFAANTSQSDIGEWLSGLPIEFAE